MDRRMRQSLDRWLTTPPEERHPYEDDEGDDVGAAEQEWDKDSGWNGDEESEDE